MQQSVFLPALESGIFEGVATQSGAAQAIVEAADLAARQVLLAGRDPTGVPGVTPKRLSKRLSNLIISDQSGVRS